MRKLADEPTKGKQDGMSVKEKRKSAVQIAAQSLDLEVQNVKNLKRLSIGSMDLMIDPELEYRVTNSSRKSVIDSVEDTSDDTTLAHDNSQFNTVASIRSQAFSSEHTSPDTTEENSFDVTGTEYLQRNNDHAQVITETNIPNTKSFGQLRRGISGAGFSRRNLVGINDKPEINTKTEKSVKDNTKSALPRNLLWVPANQHPNVKPKNYVDLVQDALHNINLEDSEKEAEQQIDEDEINDKFDSNKLLEHFNKKNTSLVRRPSRLRKSYTEFEEESDQQTQEPVNKSINDSSNKSKSPSQPHSLKCIAEELTKITHNAGLTNSDAITLAQSLKFTGSFLSSVNTPTDEKAGDEDDDNDFASNIVNRNGIQISSRTSLKRSKFITYRIRSEGDKDKLIGHNKSSTILSNGIGLKRISSNPEKEIEQRKISSSSLALSDSTITRSSSKDGMTAADGDPEVLQTTYSHDSSAMSSMDSADSVLIQPSNTKSLLQENLPDDDDFDKESEENDLSSHNGSFNDNGNPIFNFSGEPNYSPISSNDDNNDFVKTTNSELTSTQMSRAQKSNHSKNRHKPIIYSGKRGLNGVGASVVETPKRESEQSLNIKIEAPSENIKSTDNKVSSTDTSNSGEIVSAEAASDVEDKQVSEQILPKFEKKIARLFRKKNLKSTDHNYESSKNLIVKKQKSASRLRIRRSIEKLTRSQSAKSNKEPLQTEQNETRAKSSSILDTDKVEFADVQTESDSNDTNSTQSLQAAAVVSRSSSVIRNDNHVEAMEFVTELEDGEESQDVTASSLYTNNEGTNKSQAQITINSEEQNFPLSLPARKLTFEDVPKSTIPNGPMNFTDSAFGFPLPTLTVATVIMFDHRLPVNVERAIYRLSHLKLSDPKRSLREQVLLSNFMYAYLHLVNHTLYLEQIEEDNYENTMSTFEKSELEVAYNDNHVQSLASYQTVENSANGSICIPEF